jgi:hypothetical protein
MNPDARRLPPRYRQTLLDSVTDDWLEEVTLRLARDEHPAAHSSRKGKDGGIDDFNSVSGSAVEPNGH